MHQKFLCPVCRSQLINGKDSLTCSNGHVYQFSENVLILMGPEKKKKIDEYIAKYFEYRKKDGSLNLITEDFQKLPFIKDFRNSKEWQFRRYSLEVINKITNGQKIRTVLEFGPYNGWLTNRLAEKGYDVTAIDYFNDELTGLRSIKHYKSKWLPVQMDLRDLSIINSKFDLIVFNHSLHFFNSYKRIISDAKLLLNPGGKIIIVGSPFYKDPKRIKETINRIFLNFKTKYEFEFNLFQGEFRGYFDNSDVEYLKEYGFIVNQYSKLRLQNLLTLFLRDRPFFAYCTCINTGNSNIS